MNIYLVLGIYSATPFHLLVYSFICLCTSCHIFVCCDYLMYFYNAFTYFINKFQTPVWGHTEKPRESVTGLQSGMQNSEEGLCIIERKQGGDAGRCMGESVGFAAHVQSFPLKKGKQTIVTSFTDVTVVLLMLREGGYIRECTWAFGVLQLIFSGHLVIVKDHSLPFSTRKPPTPYLSYLSALWGVGLLQTGKCYLFISPVAYAQG